MTQPSEPPATIANFAPPATAEPPARPAARPPRSMPRAAIRAIAWSGHFCGLMTCFLVYFAVKHGFNPLLIGLNALTALFLFAGSLWMQLQLKKAA